MGARYYDPCARELASRGFYVAISELHGQGTNTAIATRDHNFGYHHMASSDFPRSIEAAKKVLGSTAITPPICWGILGAGKLLLCSWRGQRPKNLLYKVL